MKTIHSVPLGRLQETIATLPNPEQWGMQCIDWDYTLKQWPSREGLARTIRMQPKRARNSRDWKAVVALSDGEGY